MLMAQAVWLGGCRANEHTAEADYREARSAYLRGDFQVSIEKSREGLRRWARGSSTWGWRFRLLWAESLISTNHIPEASPLLETVPGPPADLMARWTLDQANALAPQQPKKSREFLQDARKLAADSADYTTLYLTELRLGTLAKYDEAEAIFRSVLAAAVRRRDPYLLTRAQTDLGYNRLRENQFDKAIPFLDEALATGRQCGAKPLIAAALGNLGACYFNLGDLDRAMETLTHADELFREMGMRDYDQWMLVVIGDIHLARDDFDQALAFHHRAETVARDVHDYKSLGFALNNQAEASLKKGDLAAAQRFNEQAFSVKRQLNDPRSLVHSELIAAELESRGGKYRQAERHFEKVEQPLARSASLAWCGTPTAIWLPFIAGPGVPGRRTRSTARPLTLSTANGTTSVATSGRLPSWRRISSASFRTTSIS